MWTVIAFITVTLSCIEMTVRDRGFFAREYSKLGTAQTVGLSEEDLQSVTAVLLNYLRGTADSLDIEATIANERRLVFNEREKTHMIDVRALYQKGMAVRNGGLILLLAGALLFGVLGCRSRSQGARRVLGIAFIRGFWAGCLAVLLLLAVLGGAVALDFNNFWVTLHKILFTNDLWLLDPARDILIQIVPEPFFMDFVARIIGEIVLIWGALFALSLGIWKKKFAHKE